MSEKGPEGRLPHLSHHENDGTAVPFQGSLLTIFSNRKRSFSGRRHTHARSGCSGPLRRCHSENSLDAVDEPRTHLLVEGARSQKADVQGALAHGADQPHPHFSRGSIRNTVELRKELLERCHLRGIRTRTAKILREKLLLLVEVGVEVRKEFLRERGGSSSKFIPVMIPRCMTYVS